MFKRIKKLFKRMNCEHDWHYVFKVKFPRFKSDVPVYDEKVSIYCPKCDKGKNVQVAKWRIICEQQEIKREYKAKQQAD